MFDILTVVVWYMVHETNFLHDFVFNLLLNSHISSLNQREDKVHQNIDSIFSSILNYIFSIKGTTRFFWDSLNFQYYFCCIFMVLFSSQAKDCRRCEWWCRMCFCEKFHPPDWTNHLQRRCLSRGWKELKLKILFLINFHSVVFIEKLFMPF